MNRHWAFDRAFYLFVFSVSFGFRISSFEFGCGSAAGEEHELKPPFAWKLSPPLVSPAERPDDPCCSVKDPTVVFHEGKWHIFATIRSKVRTHQIEYLCFDKWENADKAERHILKCHNAYFCAPQVFYFTPHKKWYLVYQCANQARAMPYGPCFSTSETIGDPQSWSAPQPFYAAKPKTLDKGWIDFWVICDETAACLFFTSNDGRMWRAQTALADFPKGWSDPQVCLRDDIFEASHTYKLLGRNQYVTLIEANPGGKRYYKAFLADKLDGKWTALTATEAQPFAGAVNVHAAGELWADNISHGELIRAGNDQTLTIDPAKLQFLIQGVLEKDKAGKNYGQIPWRLGLLTRDE